MKNANAEADETVAIIGLGYVGLPLAVALGRRIRTIGIDLSETKIESYRQGVDPSGEVSASEFSAAERLEFTTDSGAVAEASFVIVVVPTPIDNARRPDLRPLEGATRSVGQHLQPGTVVVFESTVYPGCTEEVCVPILEEASGLRWSAREDVTAGATFHVGYSPERINPGDKKHRLENIVKVVSGDSKSTLDRVAALYDSIIEAGVHRAASIKVAEAAKVIENTQRDLNIALMNELAVIFDRLDIDTMDVLEAAGTKWNFLPFRPGLVGGHCIGVDPYYLTHKAQSVGYHPQVVLGGRHTNDSVGRFIAGQTVKLLARAGHPVNGAVVTVLGLTFKENCPDLRNSKVIDIIRELEEFGCAVQVHEPLADAGEALSEYAVPLNAWGDLKEAHAVVFAVPHEEYLDRGFAGLRELVVDDGVIIDVKSALKREEVAQTNLSLWRL